MEKDLTDSSLGSIGSRRTPPRLGELTLSDEKCLTDSILSATKVRWSYTYIEQVLGPTRGRWSPLSQSGQRTYREQVRRYQGTQLAGEDDREGTTDCTLTED